MKPFLRRLAGFALLLGVCTGAVRLTNQFLLRYHVPTWTSEARTVLAGDSHVQLGVDPSAFRGAVNIAQPSEPLVATAAKLEHLVQRMPKLETVVIGLGPHNLAAYNDQKFIDAEWSFEMADRYYGVLDPFETGLDVGWDAVLLAETKHLWTPNLHLINDAIAVLRGSPRNEHPYIGDYHPLSDEQFEESAMDVIAARHFWVTAEGEVRSEVQGDHLRSAVELLVSRGIRVIALATPTTEEYRRAVPDELQRMFEAQCEELDRHPDVTCLDLSAEFQGLEFFRDWDHLSEAGAQKLSTRLGAWIDP